MTGNSLDSKVPQSRTILQDWEAWLTPQIRAVELLDEIPISAEERQRPGKAPSLRVRTDFKRAWAERDYRTIVQVAQRLPESVLTENSGLLVYYDNTLMRAKQEPEQGRLL